MYLLPCTVPLVGQIVTIIVTIADPISRDAQIVLTFELSLGTFVPRAAVRFIGEVSTIVVSIAQPIP